MTTIVTITACVTDNLQVLVQIIENDVVVENRYLQDSETTTVYVYDSREVRVLEVLK